MATNRTKQKPSAHLKKKNVTQRFSWFVWCWVKDLGWVLLLNFAQVCNFWAHVPKKGPSGATTNRTHGYTGKTNIVWGTGRQVVHHSWLLWTKWVCVCSGACFCQYLAPSRWRPHQTKASCGFGHLVILRRLLTTWTFFFQELRTFWGTCVCEWVPWYQANCREWCLPLSSTYWHLWSWLCGAGVFLFCF